MFYKKLKEEFKLKELNWLTAEESLQFCGLRISLEMRDGVRWHTMDQHQDMEEFITAAGMDYCVPVASLMPNKLMLTQDSPLLNAEKKGEY